jgi:hypothetical protein
MKVIIAVLVVSLMTSPAKALDVTAEQLLVPGPVSIALTIGKWLFGSNRQKVFYIEVESRADTFDAARKEAFRLAVDEAVGSLIVSETEVLDDRVVRNEIITYASGYIDRSEIVEQRREDGQVVLQMRVWVAHSSLANRLLSQSKTAGEMEGDRVHTQIQTFQQQRQAGDRLLMSVLADFPKRAFDVKMYPTKVIMDRHRQPLMYVEFDLSWSQNYLESLGEAVRVINQRTECNSWYNNCPRMHTVEVIMPGILTSNSQSWFDDYAAWSIMTTKMIQSRPVIQVSMLDARGQEQMRNCMSAAELDHSQYREWHYVESRPGKITVNGSRSKRFEGYVSLANMPVDQFDRIEVTVVPSLECAPPNNRYQLIRRR